MTEPVLKEKCPSCGDFVGAHPWKFHPAGDWECAKCSAYYKQHKKPEFPRPKYSVFD